MKIGDIVTLRRTSPEIVAMSGGMILKYVGHAGRVFNIDEKGLMAIEFRDGMRFWGIDGYAAKIIFGLMAFLVLIRCINPSSSIRRTPYVDIALRLLLLHRQKRLCRR